MNEELSTILPRKVGIDAFVSALSAALHQDLTVNYCAFGQVPTDWQQLDRFMEDHVIYLMVEGAIEGEIEGEPVYVGARSMLWTQGYTHHSFTCRTEGTVCYSTRFCLRQESRSLRLKQPYLLQEGVAGLHDWFDRLVHAHQTNSRWQDTRLKSLLLDMVMEILDEKDGRQDQDRLTREQVVRLNRYLWSNLATCTGASELAALLGWTPDYFTRRFRRHFGVPPRKWLVEERIRRAKVLMLETHLSIKEVAAAVGYADQRFFAQQFRNHTGCSPTAFRRSH